MYKLDITRLTIFKNQIYLFINLFYSRSHSTSGAASSVDQPPAYSGQPPSYQQATNNEAITDDLINLGGATGGAISPLVSEKTALIDSGGHSMQACVVMSAAFQSIYFLKMKK